MSEISPTADSPLRPAERWTAGLVPLRLPEAGWLSLASRTAVIFAPLVLLAVAALSLAALAERQALGQLLDAAQRRVVDLGRADIAAHVASGVGDIGFLASEEQLQSWLASPGPDAAGRLREQYLQFMRHNPQYDSLRLMDAGGEEIVRVDRGADGAPLAVADAALQLKSDRYYFVDSEGLPPGSVYVSPLDLNIEHGAIETPIRPTIRFAAPVFDAAGRARGVVVVNYRGQILLDALSRNAGPGGDAWLLDDRGNWLMGPDPALDWGFMYPDRHLATLASTSPDLWSAIRSAPAGEGRFADGDGQVTFGSTAADAGMATPLPPGGVLVRPTWYVLTAMSAAGVRAFHQRRGAVPAWLWWFVIGAVGIASFVFAYHWHRRVHSQQTIRELNARLDGDNHALMAVNKELEAFSYSVSHDLRTPLRSIDGFCQALEEDYADRFDEAGRAYLGRVRRAAQNMGHLIDDLLGLSRVTRAALATQTFDISALAAEVAAEIAAADPERTVDWRIAPGIVVCADPRLVRVVMANLIGNAWKFSSKVPAPVISFGIAAHEQGRALFVADNGAGFDMAYADKLFGAFQRLHSAADYPGTGIGLATVQRVVNKHGGRIWVEASPGAGATFFFTLGNDVP